MTALIIMGVVWVVGFLGALGIEAAVKAIIGGPRKRW